MFPFACSDLVTCMYVPLCLQYNDLLKKKEIVENDKSKIAELITELDRKKNEALQGAHERVNKVTHKHTHMHTYIHTCHPFFRTLVQSSPRCYQARVPSSLPLRVRRYWMAWR